LGNWQMIWAFHQYVSLRRVVLILLDSLLLALSVLAAAKVRFWGQPQEFWSYVELPRFAVQVFTLAGTSQICFYYNHLYDLSGVRPGRERLVGIGRALVAASVILGFLYFIIPALIIGRGVFFITMALVLVFGSLVRMAFDSVWHATALATRILILGTGELASGLAHEFSRRQDLNVQLVGMVETRPAELVPHIRLVGHPVVYSADELEAFVREQRVSRIIVAIEDLRGALPVAKLMKLRLQGVSVEDAHSAMAALTGRVWLRAVRPSWFIFSGGFRRSPILAVIKRAIDLAIALAALVCAAPAMALIAIAVYLDSRGPILYRQLRVGLNGKCFKVLKFRSMSADAEQTMGAQWALPADPRVTRIGRFLRKFRLDELPQLINVLRGDMSFVGPRPERPVFVERLRRQIPYYDERHSVRPGLTGWAQIQYPYGASMEDGLRKLEYDLFYLKSMSMLFDFVIVFHTVRTVLSGRGAR
jgi:sugar transferase (PEP-CTERM system associated)